MYRENDASYQVEALLGYAQQRGLISPADISYARNRLLDTLRLDAPWDGEPVPAAQDAATVLQALLDYAYDRGLFADNTETLRDLFDTRLMDAVTPRPSQVEQTFSRYSQNQGITAATDWFYQFCQDIGYIRSDRIAKNVAWEHPCRYGRLEITINLSKPEKDPREIALLKSLPAAGYPKCLLCSENVGYAGRLNHPARQTLRILPLQLAGQSWFFQYSPYVYYNEHCIVFNARHIPMKVDRGAFTRLLDFTTQFPHYFVGSNADLPIVGGSILNHDHFQGGRHQLPMAKADLRIRLRHESFTGTAGVVDWPMAALRLTSRHRDELIQTAARVLELWREYSDPSADILAHTNQGPHNTITPIARRRGDDYELDLVLRNNRTTDEHPLGIFHPHAQLHHIKKENIGLIEVMGLFILPARLKTELTQLTAYLCDAALPLDALNDPGHPLFAHAAWIADVAARHGREHCAAAAQTILQAEVGAVCEQVLHHAGVFADTPAGDAALLAFLSRAGFLPA
ncbi:MAG: UDP-glucose--hexose-1-phosphate uridylyltransferase [Eubacteriales bacterium]|nr:UDP-glucose--hexose-1-phosphate uridylyltransferase [Eubacteriales bacterium]